MLPNFVEVSISNLQYVGKFGDTQFSRKRLYPEIRGASIVKFIIAVILALKNHTSSAAQEPTY